MKSIDRTSEDADSGRDSFWGDDVDPPISPLTRAEAQALAAQAVFGVLVALIWGALSQSLASLQSALYGVAVAVLPSALMARGVFGRRAAGGVGGLLLWEILKLLMVGAMLATAPRWVSPLDWVAMMVTLVLSLKIVGVALLVWHRRTKNNV